MSNVELVFDKEFTQPGIVQLAPIIVQIPDGEIVNIPWTHTKDEIRLVLQNTRLKFCLHIADNAIMDRAIATFGLRLRLSPSLLERAKLVLYDPQAYDWRKFVEEQIPGINPRYILLQLAAEAIRRGKQPNLALVLDSLLIGGSAAIDADVLLRLKSPRIRG